MQDSAVTAQPLEAARVIIPMLNASGHLEALLPALGAQEGLGPAQVLVIDSASDDDTAARCAAWGAEVLPIQRSEFDHGGTRRMAAQRNPDARLLIFMTQDAIPAGPQALARLAAAFVDPAVGMAYGRQLPRPEARQIERHARLYNYPPASEIRTVADAPRLGIKTCFCSDSFAAYRQTALQEVGSFPREALFAEDQIVAGRMLLAGHALAYVGDAEVTHSHGYTLREEMARYFDVGVFHSRNAWLVQAFGSAEKVGAGFVSSEIRLLLRTTPWRLPEAGLRTMLKYIGYRLGRAERKLSHVAKARLSMQPSYWHRKAAEEQA